jgi:hypothetical protein
MLLSGMAKNNCLHNNIYADYCQPCENTYKDTSRRLIIANDTEAGNLEACFFIERSTNRTGKTGVQRLIVEIMIRHGSFDKTFIFTLKALSSKSFCVVSQQHRRKLLAHLFKFIYSSLNIRGRLFKEKDARLTVNNGFQSASPAEGYNGRSTCLRFDGQNAKIFLSSKNKSFRSLKILD